MTQESSTETLFRRTNLCQQYPGESIAYSELHRITTQRQSKGTKPISVISQSCNTITTYYLTEESTFSNSSVEYTPKTPSPVVDKSTYLIDKLRSHLNRKYLNYASGVMDRSRDHVTEDNKSKEPNNNYVHQIDDEIKASNDTMQNIKLSLQNKYKSRIFHSSRSPESTEMNPTLSINKYCSTEPYINENQKVKHKRLFVEKTTYCRPVVNIHGQELIYKTLKKHARLQFLVKKLILAREKEKQNEAWNNYINELKHKHGYYSRPTELPKAFATQETKPCIIDDCYESKHQSNLCEFLVEDFYRISNNSFPNQIVPKLKEDSRSPCKLNEYASNEFCFPISSQARISILNREKFELRPYRILSTNHKSHDSFMKKPLIDRTLRKNKFKQTQVEKENQTGEQKSNTVQTIVNKSSTRATQISEVDKELKYQSKYNSQIEKTKMMTKCKCCYKNSSYSEITNKLDMLNERLNSFLQELKSNKLRKNKSNEDISLYDIYKAKSDTNCSITQEPIIVGSAREKITNILCLPKRSNNRQDTIDEILNKEIDKSNKVKSNIEKILDNNISERAVNITIDIPTKERFEEMKNTFNERDEYEMINAEKNSADRRMTMAVNTDPLGLLALIRISTDTVKQVLSYVPNIDYVFNFPRLYMSIIGSSPVVANSARFLCNICGLSFTRPSQLSDHIHHHYLSNTRNCHIRRHALKMQCRCSSWFACRHCGRMFTRAYCRQLHEQTCSMNVLGTYDVTSSLMLLSYQPVRPGCQAVTPGQRTLDVPQ